MAVAKGGGVAPRAGGRKKKSERIGYCFGILPAIIHPEAMQENPRLCSAMTVTSWCQMAFVVYLLTLHDPPPTETWRPLAEFVVFMFATMLLIPAVKSVARAFGSTFGTAAKLKKARNLRKFSDQAWQLTVHAGFSACEYYLMNREEYGSRTWWSDIGKVGVGAAWEPTRQNNDIWLFRFSICQLAVWFYTAFSHRYVEARHKDYFMMFGHHVVTVALISLAIWQGSYRIILLVLWCHDFSDIFLDCMKMSNYMGWEGPRHLFLTEGLFVSVVGTWFYWRLYLYPFKVVHSVYAYGPQFYDQYLGVSFQYYGRHICIALLCVLAIMHIFWFFLICKILVKLVKGTKAHDAGAEEYEGDSSDSGDEWEDEPGARRPPCIDFSRGAAELSAKQRAKKQAKRSKSSKGAQ